MNKLLLAIGSLFTFLPLLTTAASFPSPGTLKGTVTFTPCQLMLRASTPEPITFKLISVDTTTGAFTGTYQGALMAALKRYNITLPNMKNDDTSGVFNQKGDVNFVIGGLDPHVQGGSYNNTGMQMTIGCTGNNQTIIAISLGDSAPITIKKY